MKKTGLSLFVILTLALLLSSTTVSAKAERTPLSAPSTCSLAHLAVCRLQLDGFNCEIFPSVGPLISAFFRVLRHNLSTLNWILLRVMELYGAQ